MKYGNHDFMQPCNHATMQSGEYGHPRFGGFRIVLNPFLVETVAAPRSPGRSRRRAARGFRQCYKTRPLQQIIKIEDALHMHPAIFPDVLSILQGLP